MWKYRNFIAPGVLASALLATLGFAFLGRGPANLGACTASGAVGGDLGGDFSLLSEEGIRQSSKDIFAAPSLVYFGYTFCPDVCPFDVARNAEVVEHLSEMGLTLKPIFITIDPERDRPDILREYTDYMHPEMVGFTGSVEDIKKAARAYRVYYKKQPSDDAEFYLVDHSVLSYLVFPEHGFVDFFGRNETSADIATQTACFLRAAGYRG